MFRLVGNGVVKGDSMETLTLCFGFSENPRLFQKSVVSTLDVDYRKIIRTYSRLQLKFVWPEFH